MKTLHDPTNALAAGLADIRREFALPENFPPAVLAEAEAAAARVPSEHVDRTDRAFVTLDPASSTDLDQAFAIERAGSDLLLHYAIADVAWFISPGGAIDREAWSRAETIYLPDGKVPLYPSVIGERAASLLPDGPRPAIVFAVRVDPDGNARLDAVERAIVRSRAKLAYDRVTDADVPDGFVELAARIAIAETRRGAARVDPPAQEVEAGDDGNFRLVFRPMLESEVRNAAMSLATNLAVADALLAHHTGLFRVMPEPDAAAVARLRREAQALGLAWRPDETLADLERRLDAADAKQAAFMLAARRAGGGASYAPYHARETPWHAAVATTYAHATAPLRRLADRYVILAALAVANGRPVPDEAAAAFATLPEVMARGDAIAGRVDRAVIDLAEAVSLAGREGERFSAVVTDVEGKDARIRLTDPPVVARLPAPGVAPGDALSVELVAADVAQRKVSFRVA